MKTVQVIEETAQPSF